MNNFIELERGKSYKIKIINKVDKNVFKEIPSDTLIIKTLCPHCDVEKVESRFDILDIR